MTDVEFKNYEQLLALKREIDEKLKQLCIYCGEKAAKRLEREFLRQEQKIAEMTFTIYRPVDNVELAQHLFNIATLLVNNKVEYDAGGIIFSGSEEDGYIEINGNIKLKFINGNVQ